MGDRTFVHRDSDIVSEIVDGRAVLLNAQGTELITLNPVGTLVWEAMERPVPLEEIVEHVASRVTGTSEEQIRTDVVRFLDELRSLELIGEGHAPSG